ncbi:MAG: ATP-binding cassette domain-containing protein [Oscillospiraceae bacterium]|nr:ATP-binding cassette domain-containing protein [Oscillospiraceae bacterium]
MALKIDIEKKFGTFRLQIKLNTEDEVLGLVGNSGCGKSLTLKCIAGIEKPDRGRIVLNGITLFDSEKHINLSPQKRRTGLLFQNYALFPNMTVRQNIRAGTLRDQQNEKERENKVDAIMDSFGLSSLASHYPRQLSGGQQQRTALARILVSEPQILMLDEPFSALDSELKFRMEKEVRDVIQRFGKTTILVSHDRGEAYRLCDRIAIVQDGKADEILLKEEWLLKSNSVIITTDSIPQNVILVSKEP